MRRRPRNATDGIFANGMGMDCLVQGACIGVLTLVSYFVGLGFESVPVADVISGVNAGRDGMADGELPPVVRVGLSGRPLTDHYRLGILLRETAEALGRRIAVIASGDLSHRLRKDGPYGLRPEGPEYDRRIMANSSEYQVTLSVGIYAASLFSTVLFSVLKPSLRDRVTPEPSVYSVI